MVLLLLARRERGADGRLSFLVQRERDLTALVAPPAVWSPRGATREMVEQILSVLDDTNKPEVASTLTVVATWRPPVAVSVACWRSSGVMVHVLGDLVHDDPGLRGHRA